MSSASPEDLERLARVVDDKISALVPPGRTITPQALLLAAMALAHDLDEERARADALRADAGRSVARILVRVDEALSALGAPAGEPAHGARDDARRALESRDGASEPADR